MPVNELLTQENLNAVKGLELLARSTVAGLLPGLHQSQKTGFGQEFSHYRSYQPGDDLRLLDWKLYARSDRFYVRQAEVETHITVRFIVDASASMLHEDAGMQKIQFCRYLVATLAWLAQTQGDNIGLYALNNSQLLEYRPRQGRQSYQHFLHELLQITPKGEYPQENFHTLFKIRPKREIIIFLTDMYEQHDELLDTLKQLHSTGNEVLLFHLMAANELRLPYSGILTFEDLENGKTIQVDSRKIRTTYQTTVQKRIQNIRTDLLNMGISYNLLSMDKPIGNALQYFLERRQKLAV